MNQTEWENLISVIKSNKFVESKNNSEEYPEADGMVHTFEATSLNAETIQNFARKKHPGQKVIMREVKRNNLAAASFTYDIYVKS